MKPDSLPSPKILLIDSSVREQTSLALVDDKDEFVLHNPVKAQELPTLIEDFLAKQKVNPQDLDAIAVVTNEGSVTGIRIGTAVANTLAWLWKKPVINCPADSFEFALKLLRENKNLPRHLALTESI